jgi:two-component system, chemotaxis family, response regulator Rcp1
MIHAMNGSINILLVEDNPGDVDLAKDALEQFKTPHTLHIASDGAQALELLFGSERAAEHRPNPARPGPALPDLILLDLNLPKIDGREVLAIIKKDERLCQIPIIVLTSSNAEHDLLRAYRSHANCFLTKPADLELFFAMFAQIERFWLELVKLPHRLAPLRH